MKQRKHHSCTVCIFHWPWACKKAGVWSNKDPERYLRARSLGRWWKTRRKLVPIMEKARVGEKWVYACWQSLLPVEKITQVRTCASLCLGTSKALLYLNGTCLTVSKWYLPYTMNTFFLNLKSVVNMYTQFGESLFGLYRYIKRSRNRHC